MTFLNEKAPSFMDDSSGDVLTPQLSATPNPAPTGTTDVSWDTGNGNDGYLYVRPHGCEEVLVARGTRGSQEVTWIAPCLEYEFSLYGDPARTALLASIVVRRQPGAGQLLVQAAQDPLLLQGCVVFRCNICGRPCLARIDDLERERPSCTTCGSTVRWRSIIHVLSMELFGKPLVLPDFPARRDLVGIGLSDWEGYAVHLAERFTYKNTFYHQEPKLDIGDLDRSFDSTCDFVIASDVFEHVTPPVERAFMNVRRLLKPNGCFIMTVPYGKAPTSLEHFPELHEFQILETQRGRLLRNVTRDGRIQMFDRLHFHGGDGLTLEMRQFSELGLRQQFTDAGLSFAFHSTPYYEFGIHWIRDESLPVVGRVRSR